MKLTTIVNKNLALKNKIQKIHKEGSNLKLSQKASVSISPGNTNIKSPIVAGSSEIKVGNNTIIKSGGSNTINVDNNTTVTRPNSNVNIPVGKLDLKPNESERTEVTFVNDSVIKGGYRVVNTIQERDDINCCYRKLGMVVVVVGQDYSFKEYTIRSGNPCTNSNWEELLIKDGDIILEDDYSDLSSTIETQRELNQIFKQLLLDITNNVGGDKNYIHDQIIPSTIWEINHSLNKKVSVTIIDTAGTVVEGKVTVNNGSKVTVEFNFPFNGEAILN